MKTTPVAGLVVFHGTEEEFQAYQEQERIRAELERQGDDGRREEARQARQRLDDQIVEEAKLDA